VNPIQFKEEQKACLLQDCLDGAITKEASRANDALKSGIYYIDYEDRHQGTSEWAITVYYHPNRALTFLLAREDYLKLQYCSNLNKYTWPEFKALFNQAEDKD